jgi:NADH-quinone oxidoreductase subunit H
MGMDDLWSNMALPGIIIAGKIIAVLVPLLVGIAYLTYAERKVLALMQLRQGPIVVGPFGLFQPLADAIKLLHKETIVPAGANRALFMLAPVLTFLLSLSAWAVMPFGDQLVVANINVGVLYLFAISSLGVYGILMAGWSSNSKYPFLGGMRSAAQMVSYEVSLGLVMVAVLLTVGSLNLTDIVMARQPWWLWLLLSPMMIVFFISALAETNRVPFDLPEGESEIVGGFNTEYSSLSFGLFFLGEYANMILLSAMTCILFLGGWLPLFGWHLGLSHFLPYWLVQMAGAIWFCIKISGVLFVFLWVRATVPRYRYDQLMRLGWKIFLPFSLIWVVLIAGVMLATGYHPAIEAK